MCRVFFVFLVLLSFSLKVWSEDYILIIDSYGSWLEWSGQMGTSFREELKQQVPDIRIYNECLNAHRTSDPETWEETTALILKHYAANPPKIVVLIADPAWMAYRATYTGQFGNVQVLLCGVKKRSLSLEKYKDKNHLHPEDFEYTEQLCPRYHATGIIEELYVKKTLDLMQALQPGMQEIAVIGDNNFYGLYTHLLIEEYLQKTSSSLKYVPLDGRFLTTDSLYLRLGALPPQAGILMGCWLLDARENIETCAQVYSRIIQTAKRPVYALNDWGSINPYFTGGYYSTSYNYGQELARMALRILFGEEAGNIPPISNIRETGIHLNVARLHEYGLSIPELSGEKVYYYNIPPGFFLRHKQLLIFVFVVIFLGGSLILIFRTRTRFRKYQKKLHISQNEIDTSISNQQHLSQALRIFLQEKTERDSVHRILNQLLKEMEADRAYVFEFDDEHQTSSNTYEVCNQGISPQISFLQNLPNADIPWLYSKMQDDRLLITEDIPASKNSIPATEYTLLKEQGILSMFVAPLHYEGKLWGYLGVDYVRKKKKCDQQEMLYLRNLSRVLCIGIEHFRSEERNRISLQKVAELEALFSYASAHANVGFAQWNPFTRKGFATAPWFENLGETTRNIENVIGIYRQIHPDDRLALNQYTESVLAGNRQPFINNIRVSTPAGWHWYKYHITCRTNHTGQTELLFLSIDIDNLKKTEDSLRKAKAKAEESDKLKSAFIANISHEIRTPLNAIVGFSNLLVNHPDIPEKEKEEYLRLITVNNDILLQLINDILDISRIEAGMMEYSTDTIELDSFCQELETIYQHRAKSGVEVRFIRQAPESLFLVSDHNRLNQVLTNLLTNAVKFTSDGHIHFGYDLRGEEIRFYVEDTGTGIPQEKQAEIFKRFVKLDSFTQGTGLGLSICCTIIEKFGGQIGVDSIPGQGSTFWFTVPREKNSL